MHNINSRIARFLRFRKTHHCRLLSCIGRPGLRGEGLAGVHPKNAGRRVVLYLTLTAIMVMFGGFGFGCGEGKRTVVPYMIEVVYPGVGGAAGGEALAGSMASGGSTGDDPTRNAPLEGVYTVTGYDPTWGAYTGAAEIRPAAPEGDELIVIHTQRWIEATFEGESIGLVWQGDVTSSTEPYVFSVELGRVGFVFEYGTENRGGVPSSPVRFNASFQRTGPATLKGSFEPAGEPEISAFSETWGWQRESEPTPIWQNLRQVVASHEAIPAKKKGALFQLYGSYHDLAEVAPYTSRPEFEEAMHYFIFDPTDYDFYQSNPKVIRVIQKVVDPINIVEARRRNRAYRDSLAKKAAYFDAEMPLHHLNEVGIYSHYNPNGPPGQQFDPSGDGTLWTGTYAASQAMRYLETGLDEAYANMIRALDGLLLCFDIAPEPGDFCRAVRPHIDDGNPKWVQGLGPYEAYDWRPGGNNDMLKGYAIGFAFGWLALEQAGADPTRQAKMVAIVEELIDDSPIGGDGKINQMLLEMLAMMMLQDDLVAAWQHEAMYEALFIVVKPVLIGLGNGASYEYGTSDWSGNNLTVNGLLIPYVIAEYLKHPHLQQYRVGMRNGLQRLRHTRLGLYQLVTGALGDFATPPPELDDALWVLREFAAPKVRHEIDHRLSDEFCMSPFPNLPWKMDWSEHDRTKSLHSYPLFERNVDDVQWKSDPFEYKGGVSERLDAGTDFLFAYWFARRYGVIDETW